jgi:hypothetical protein
MATNYKDIQKELHESLNILREREAKYGGNAPIDLLNQIADYKTAITLTEQVVKGTLGKSNWRQAMRPLMVTIRERGEGNKACKVTVGQILHNVQQVKIGNVDGGIEDAAIAGRDIIYNITYYVDPSDQISSPPGLPQTPKPTESCQAEAQRFKSNNPADCHSY